MRSNQHPPAEVSRHEWESNDEFDAVLTDKEIEATLLERLEALELTWKILESGLLDDHNS
ncbi:MAG: hypothetical protein ACPGF7_06750 [Pontibacterium sp.]